MGPTAILFAKAFGALFVVLQAWGYLWAPTSWIGYSAWALWVVSATCMAVLIAIPTRTVGSSLRLKLLWVCLALFGVATQVPMMIHSFSHFNSSQYFPLALRVASSVAFLVLGLSASKRQSNPAV